MSTDRRDQLFAKARNDDISVEDNGGGWYIVEGRKVRGLDNLEKAIEVEIEGGEDAPKSAFIGLNCLCGCGRPTDRDVAAFRTGHDAKLRSKMLKVARDEQGPEIIPEIVVPFLEVVGPSILRPFEDVSVQDVIKRLS